MNNSNSFSIVGALSFVTILSTANPVEVVSQIALQSISVSNLPNNSSLTNTASFDFREYTIPKESFATRYKRIITSKKFRNGYENHSLGERILVE